MRRNPYKFDGPAVISFSGGRTSGMMLWSILDANDGVLPIDVHAIFANTGKEMPETLDFVQECSQRWNVPITWLEYADHDEPQRRWKEVTAETASRDGQPRRPAFCRIDRAKTASAQPRHAHLHGRNQG